MMRFLSSPIGSRLFRPLAIRSVPCARRGLSSRFSGNLRALALLVVIGITTAAQAALIDVWRAEDINLDDGDGVGSWSSASNRVAGASGTETPILRKNATPV